MIKNLLIAYDGPQITDVVGLYLFAESSQYNTVGPYKISIELEIVIDDVYKCAGTKVFTLEGKKGQGWGNQDVIATDIFIKKIY